MADRPDPLFELAWQLVEQTDAHVFLTGRAGTGKTTFLRQLRERCPKRMVVAAPTGVAAVNAGGVTLHSFFQLPLAPFIPGAQYHSQKHYQMPKLKRDIIRSLDLLVIDEISMVRADLLDAVDDALRRYRDPSRPFGGVQLLLIGDLQQLPPVVTHEDEEIFNAAYETPYFFSSHALQALPLVPIELQTVYRQSDDPAFLSILNAIRQGAPGAAELAALNARVAPGFVPPDDVRYIQLTSHNRLADAVNAKALADLPGPAATYRADVTGDFPESSLPTDPELVLKPGAQVMFIKNDTAAEHRFYNGLIGTVRGVSAKSVAVEVPGRDDPIEVEPLAWENKRYTLDPTTKAITEQVEGTFRQLPLRLAWAVTIHKSQGLTFDHVIIDAARAFAHGQVYVALSRCRTLQGIVLRSPISAHNLVNDDAVARYIEAALAQTPPDALPALLADLRANYRRTLLQDLFRFDPLEKAVALVAWALREDYAGTYPALAAAASASLDAFRDNIALPADKFCGLIARRPLDELASDAFQSRIAAGAAYFREHLDAALSPWLADAVAAESDSQEAAKRLARLLGELLSALQIRQALLAYAATCSPETPFDISAYLDARRKAILATLEAPRGARRAAGGSSVTSTASGPAAAALANADIAHPALLSQLRSWRSMKAKERKLPAYCILSQKALHALANKMPLTRAALANTPFIGDRSFANYADELIPLIRAYAASRNLLPDDLPDDTPETLF